MKSFIIILILFIKLFLFSVNAEDWICPNSGTTNKANWNFCYICGTAKPVIIKEIQPREVKEDHEQIECLSCGHLYNKIFRYCPECNVQNYSFLEPKKTEFDEIEFDKDTITARRDFLLRDIQREKTVQQEYPDFLQDLTRTHFLIMSSLCPGSGQYLMQRRFKGISFALLSYGSIIYGYHNRRQADKEYRNIRGVTLTKHNQEEYMYYRDKVKSYNRTAEKFYTIGAIIWIYNLFDTSYTYNEFKLEQRRMQIQFSGQSASVSTRF